ncbi:MAG: T9SS type A sorting domain-containing protein, partial [Bacteroidales bacterium]
SISIAAQTGPGGVGGHEDDILEGAPVNAFWLRAGDLSLSNGADVTKWDDISGYNHSAITGVPGAGGIKFETGKLNGHPWVHFHGVNFLKVADHDILDGGEGFAIFIVAKRDSFKVEKYGSGSNLVTKRAHWNAWSHIPEISLDAAGLQHAYEIRWDRINTVTPGADSANITAYMNGNLPDGSGSDVFPTPENTPDTDRSYIISWAYSGREDSYGAFVRIDGLMTNRRYEGNPNPIIVGDVVNSPKDLYLGAAQLDPPGAFGDNPSKDDACPTCTEESYLEGALAEVIIYKGTLWHSHVHIVENYLSLKYDLPIGEEKYYDDEVFIHDLIGIGNELGDDKKQIQSKAGAIMLEELNESLDAAKEYVFLASDGAEYTPVEEGMADDNVERWGRTWKLEELGEADVVLTFDFIEAGLKMETVQNYRIAYKASLEEDFMLLEAMPKKVLRSLSFNLEGADLESGYYSLAYIKDASSMDDLNVSSSMVLYPNPAAEKVQIHFQEEVTGQLNIRILDYTGREVYRFVDSKNTFDYYKGLNTGDLESGTYFIEVRIKDFYAVKPLLKK